MNLHQHVDMRCNVYPFFVNSQTNSCYMQHAAYLNRPRTILADFTGQRPWQSCTAPWIVWCFCIQSHDDGNQDEINLRCQLVFESRRKTIAKGKMTPQMPGFQNSSSVPGCIISCSIMYPFQEILMSWCDIACLDLHLSGLELLGLRSTTWRRQGTCFLWCHTKWTCSEHVSCWQERIIATFM